MRLPPLDSPRDSQTVTSSSQVQGPNNGHGQFVKRATRVVHPLRSVRWHRLRFGSVEGGFGGFLVWDDRTFQALSERLSGAPLSVALSEAHRISQCVRAADHRRSAAESS